MNNRRQLYAHATEAGNAASHALCCLIAAGWLLVALVGEALTTFAEGRYQRLSGEADPELAHHVNPLREREAVCPAK